MKHFTLTAVAIAAIMTACSFTSNQGPNITQDYDAQAFTAIQMEGVGTIRYTQGDTYSVRLEGSTKGVEHTQIKYSDGRLIITQDKDWKGDSGNLVIYVSSPSLSQLDIRGVGNFESKDSINLDGDLVVNVDGVGAIDVKHIACRSLKVHHEGVGASNLTARCRTLLYESNGVGGSVLDVNVDTLKLSNRGVGAMKVEGSARIYERHCDGFTSHIEDKGLSLED